MSASLVGSEMCIRDRLLDVYCGDCDPFEDPGRIHGRRRGSACSEVREVLEGVAHPTPPRPAGKTPRA
eukprot:1741221-Alexandrium_andersonii.AAC.1